MTKGPSTSSNAAARKLQVPGVESPLCLRGIRPRGKVVPLVLHFHGGAYTSGGLDSGEHLAELLVGAGAVVASLNYPLAPEHRFPEAVEAGYAALEALYKQRTRLAGSGAPLFVAGEEAGGNLAAAVAMMVRDRSHPPLSGQVLVTPMLDPCAATPSLREVLGPQTTCKWSEGWQQYLRGPMDAEHPYAVPCRAQRLAGLAPALVLTGEDDPFHDEALAYAQRLRHAGVVVSSAVLGPATGWPDSLETQSAGECPCGQAVQQHVRAFFAGPLPTPS